MNKKINPKNETKNVNTCLKRSYSSTHMNMVEATQKVNQILVECNHNQTSQKPMSDDCKNCKPYYICLCDAILMPH